MTIRPAPLLFLILACACGGNSPAATAGKRKPVPAAADGDAAPALIAKDGGPKSQWKDLAGLQDAAAKGNPKACYDLALLCLEGSPPDIARDPARAVRLYEQAAKGGVHDAWFRLAKIFHDGVGVPADLPRAFGYYLESARRGVPEGQHNVGAMLVSGRGVKRDYVEGLAWLIVAGKSGVGADDELKVRAHLARKPNQVAAAERRALELGGRAAAAPPAVPAAGPAQPEKPAGAPVAIERIPPRIEVTAPSLKPDLPPALPLPLPAK